MVDRVTDALFQGHPNVPARLHPDALYGLPTGEALARLRDEAARATAEQGPESAARVQEILELGAAVLPNAELAELVATMRAATGAWFAPPANPCSSTRPPRRGCVYGHQHKGRPRDHAERSTRNGHRRAYASTLPLIRPGREGRDAATAALSEMAIEGRKALSQAEWLSRVPEDVDLVLRKSDFRRNVGAVLQPLAWGAQWDAREADEATDGLEMTTRPTRARMAEWAGVSTRTVTRIISWLIRRGWLALVEAGTTEAIRRGLLFPLADPHDGEGNRAAVYLLTIPTSPLPLSSIEGAQDGQNPNADQAENTAPPIHDEDHEDSVCINLSPLPGSLVTHLENTTTAPVGASARTRGTGEGQTDRTKDSSGRAGIGIFSSVPCGRWSQRDRLRAAEVARAADPALMTLSPRRVRSLLTPWWKPGWTIADIVHAINVNPDGVPWEAIPLPKIRNVGAWVSARLSHWADEQGVPTLSPSQRQARDGYAARTVAEATRDALAQTDAPTAVPGQGPTGKAALTKYREQAAARDTSAQVQQAAQQRRDAEFRERMAARTAPAAPAHAPAERPEGVTPLDWARAQADAARAKTATRDDALPLELVRARAHATAQADDWTPPQPDPAELEAVRAANIRARALARAREDRRNR